MASTETESVPVAENLKTVIGRVTTAADGKPVRLVAVSKTKPVELLQAAYDAGHRCFGENYVQEISEKAPQLPDDISWHFIGHLQSNKAGPLLKSVMGGGRKLTVETVDTQKLANTLEKEVKKLNDAAGGEPKRLPVYIQINSSGEGSKNGITKDELVDLVSHISAECKSLELTGLMTIGAPDYSGCRTQDFVLLKECKRMAEEALGGSIGLELSMGMSNDFETAIREGSTSVRVGSSIFGARNYNK